MKLGLSHRLALPLIYLLGAAAVAGWVGWMAFFSALAQLQERGRADLELSGDRLTSYLQRYRELAVVLSDHPTLVPLVLGTGGATDRAAEFLQGMADKTGAFSIQAISGSNPVVASVPSAFFAGLAPAIDRAMTGALGSVHFVGPQDRRIFAYAAPVFGPDGKAAGSVIVSVDASTIEWNWPADPLAVYFSGQDGLVIVSNRSELVLTSPQGSGSRKFPQIEKRNLRGFELWRIEGGPYLPERALHMSKDMPVISLQGQVLLDLQPAYRIAWLQGLVAGAVLFGLGAILFIALERRRTLNQRLADQTAAQLVLEERVKERTREITTANTKLQVEVRERQDAEAALRKAQSDLVQAGKLRALGEMSAGISHELNQPLMAIRSFAENASVYLDRKEPEVTRDNLSRISELSRRMGRIIKNLRAFARQESEPMTDVDLVAVIGAVLEISEGRLAETGVTVDWDPPEYAVLVRGGEVRLQQVVLNLVSNAVDAMAQSDTRILGLAIAKQTDKVWLNVSDTGPGISEPDKIFDPFYSTKSVGQADGMGLGLSISYGLVQSFGGQIKGRNRRRGGAVFTVDLAPAEAEKVA